MSTTETPPTPETPDTQEAPAPPTPPQPPAEAPATPSEPEAATAVEDQAQAQQAATDPDPSLGQVGAAGIAPVSEKYSKEKAEFFAALDAVEVAVQRSQTLPEARDKVAEYMNKVRQKIAELEAQD